MYEFVTYSENIVFTAALMIMLGLCFIEILSLLIGGGLSDTIDQIFHIDVDINSKDVSWIISGLEFGQVPFLVLMVAHLTAFGVSGLCLQWILTSLLGTPITSWIVAPVALVIGFYPARSLCRIIGRLFPKIETSSVSEASFVGKIAKITLGTARKDKSAEAKLVDQYGVTHYVRVVPYDDNTILEPNTEIVLVCQKGNVFQATRM